MKIRVEVAELLRAGLANRAIAQQLHVDAKGVGRARELLGLPKAKPGRKGADSPEALFWQRAKPTDDGHMEWGGFYIGTTPGLRHGGKNQTAYRIAFRIANDREPVGKALPSCGHARCVKPDHQTDQADRDRAREQERRVDDLYDAIFGADT